MVFLIVSSTDEPCVINTARAYGLADSWRIQPSDFCVWLQKQLREGIDTMPWVFANGQGVDFNLVWNAANPPPANWQAPAAFALDVALPPLGLFVDYDWPSNQRRGFTFYHRKLGCAHARCLQRLCPRLDRGFHLLELPIW